jgi:uncharacterized protein (DUF302 family)
MEYYFSKKMNISYSQAIEMVTEKLNNEGFGIITTIHMHEKLKEKLDVDYKKYTILGACNPAFAYKALLAEEKIGTMLPCNVLVIEQENGQTEVAAVNPIASMQAIQNQALGDVAQIVTNKLKTVIESL